MNKLQAATFLLVKASNGNPIISTLVIVIFHVAFDRLEMKIEILLFGEHFVHWLDPIFILGFIAYAVYAIWIGGIYKISKCKC